MRWKRDSAPVKTVLFLILCSYACSSPQPTFEEQHLVAALEAVASTAKTPGNGERLSMELSAIGQKISALRQMDEGNQCFTAAVDRCHSAYIMADRAWKEKLAATTARRIADLELTYNFSLSFAALSLGQAKDCYSNR